MERTTAFAAKLIVIAVGPDGKQKKTYELFEKDTGFADVANTLDHVRGHTALMALEDQPPETKKARVA